MTARLRPWHLMLGWLLAGGLVIATVPYLIEGVPGWRLPGGERGALALFVLGFLLSGIPAVLRARRGAEPTLRSVLAGIGVVFALVFLALLLLRWDYSRWLLVLTVGGALLAIPLLVLRPQGLLPPLALAAVLLGAGLLGVRRPASRPVAPATLIRSSQYSLQLELRGGVIPTPRIRGGGLARLGNRYLLLTGEGRFYLVDWRLSDDSLLVEPLALRVPANLEEFQAAVAPAAGTGSQAPHWFRGILGFAAAVQGDSLDIYAAFLQWHGEAKCFGIRVASLRTSTAGLLAGSGASGWRTLFDSSPCLPPRPSRFSDSPLFGHEAGGRLVLLGRDSLLLSTGHLGYDGLTIPAPSFPQDRTVSYGKTILIHLDGRAPELYTLGHRNPQGLYRGADGALWLTEHGPRGGDELNLLRRGADYGWPTATYGTDYGSLEWPATPGRNQGFELPAHVWIPSIAVSDLIELEGILLPEWRGDLLVGSLTDRALHRIRLSDARVLYTERVPIERRIRSLIEGADGRIVLWTDEGELGSLRPNRGRTGAELFELRCAGCHRIADGTQHTIGPDLAGVVGREVGSLPGTASPALRGLGGRWTPEKLDAFLRSPAGVVPGTRMIFPGLPDPADRKLMLEFLAAAGRR